MPAHEIAGETCAECGMEHEVVESIPSRPASSRFLDALEETDRFTFARAVMWLPGGESGEEVAEDIVLATDDAALLLSLYEAGWVTIDRWKVEDDETIEECANDLWMQASSTLSEAVSETLEGS